MKLHSATSKRTKLVLPKKMCQKGETETKTETKKVLKINIATNHFKIYNWQNQKSRHVAKKEKQPVIKTKSEAHKTKKQLWKKYSILFDKVIKQTSVRRTGF